MLNSQGGSSLKKERDNQQYKQRKNKSSNSNTLAPLIVPPHLEERIKKINNKLIIKTRTLSQSSEDSESDNLLPSPADSDNPLPSPNENKISPNINRFSSISEKNQSLEIKTKMEKKAYTCPNEPTIKGKSSNSEPPPLQLPSINPNADFKNKERTCNISQSINRNV